jgi:ATP/maltotriose-dependent transcriptional regulator MalT
MDLLEIIMLIMGIIIIIVSSRMVSRPDKDKKSNLFEDNSKNEPYKQEELSLLEKQQRESLSSISEDIIAKTDDYLSKLSNEKIMAVNDFSNQILEQITNNHEEVIFLYNMLNNKENEIKEDIKEIDNSLRRANETVEINYDDTEPSKSNSDPIETNNVIQSVSVNNREILELYYQGKSVIDISRQLGIGQGEVKLVIDLFKDK